MKSFDQINLISYIVSDSVISMKCVFGYQHELYISVLYYTDDTLSHCWNTAAVYKSKKKASAKLVVPICRDWRNLITQYYSVSNQN